MSIWQQPQTSPVFYCAAIWTSNAITCDFCQEVQCSCGEMRWDRVIYVESFTRPDETRPWALKTLILRSNQIAHAKLTPTTTLPIIHVHEESSERLWHLQLFVTQWWSCKALTKNIWKHLYWLVGEIQFTFISIAHYIIQIVSEQHQTEKIIVLINYETFNSTAEDNQGYYS